MMDIIQSLWPWPLPAQHHWSAGSALIISLLTALILVGPRILRRARHHTRDGTSVISKQTEPPGTNGWPVLGETLAFIAATRSSQGVYEFVRRRHRRFGDVFKTRIFGKTHVFVPGREAAKIILRAEFSRFAKSYISSMRNAIGDQSLFTVPQHSHTKIRTLIADHLLSAQAMARSLQRMDTLFIRTLDSWKRHHGPRNPIRMLDYALDMTFRVMCGMLMSAEDEGVLGFVRQNVDRVSDAMLSVPVMCPGMEGSKFARDARVSATKLSK